MLKASKDGQKAEADVINDKLMLLHQRLFLESNPIPAKMSLQLMNKIDSGIRPPLISLADMHLESLKEALRVAGII